MVQPSFDPSADTVWCALGRCSFQAWADTPAVTTVVLKLMTELATNKGDRIMFGNMSPNGILLFREISKVVCAYASRIVSVTPTVQEYANKYKGISVCLHMISLSLIGGYVQFGVFELYGDKALDNAMQASVQMALCIPLEKVVVRSVLAVLLQVCRLGGYLTWQCVTRRTPRWPASSLASSML